ncbi:hypothetical protein COCVIDRAFT_89939 [Bipolaris victoriae FI3]|uniref:C2H2-type domain-containing protein n=2 Tax=Bipolaris TaxID=33194 RepID=W6YHU9_COCC2|nr:uncharacterized protein COCCADRAFT_31952 [Bipolaris zeicola 26-R-13]XP_014560240.1 hypothetical protein COCVIDRAFT_89939 [Bipolaris victoriae FI3]EUC38887.1 hypothetical protein COCCADRAFT_31952 [Bipolaris zeicola 26-R-13]
MSTTIAMSPEKSQHTSLTLWDIDRVFQDAHEAYEQWQARHRRSRSKWVCFGTKNRDDAMGKALSLGRQVQRIMEAGKEAFGVRFEEGDQKCNTVLSAQLLRVQYEIRQPLYDSAFSATPITPIDDIITTAKSVRRACLTALRDQYARLETPILSPVLPPPRFKVEFCPFADQLRKDLKETKTSTLRAKKAYPHDKYDDREICPHCSACISVAAHSGLPASRCILFTSHIALDPVSRDDKATFACNSCYKTFDDSYAFLDHFFQKQIGSDRSCLRLSITKSTSSWFLNEEIIEADPLLVEQCLKNCIARETMRGKQHKRAGSRITIREVRCSD